VGGVVPGDTNTAVWNDTITADRSQVIGANLDWLGIRIANPGGTAALMTIGATTSATLSLRGGGIDMSAATVDLTIGAQLNLTQAQIWNVASGRTLTTSGSLTSGTAALTLTGGGTVAVGNALLGSGPLDLSNITLRSTSLTTRTFQNAVTLSGDIGAGGTGVAGPIIFGGNIAVGNAARTITLQSSNNNPTLADIILTLGSNTQNGVISGGSGGSLALENGNASGQVIVRLGASAGSFENSIEVPFSLGERVIAIMSKNFFVGQAPVNVDGRLGLSNGSSGIVNPVVTGLTGSGFVDSGRSTGGGTSTLTINGNSGTGTFGFSGTIENGASGFVAITKSGSTTQIFSGSNTYAGQTIVSGGSLLLNGTLVQPANIAGGFASATNGRVRVENGGVFGGSGRINATLDTNANANNLIYVLSGGTIAPGASIGTLTIDGANFTRTGGNDRLLNMASGAAFNFELSGSGGTPDRIDFWNYAAGDLVLNNNTVNLSLAGPVTAGTYTVNIFRFFSDNGTTATASSVTSGLTLGTLDPDIQSASIGYDSANGLISVQYVAVPEPGTVALVGGLATLVMVALRRRFS
jgi:autotransporter-associated beta strand protein